LFVRELRQRLVAYHNRLAAVADMRKAAGLGADEQKRKRRRKQIAATEDDGSALEPSEEDGAEEDDSDNNGTPRIVDIGLADAEAKQVKIDWSNGDVCRLLIDDGGEVEKCVMYGAQGQDTPAAREFLQRITRVEKLPATIRRKRRLNLS
jgi:central kinetochore subunit Mal2/MCM21